MANQWMPSGLEALATGAVDFSGDTIKVAALSSTYVRDDAHTVVDDLSGVLDTATISGLSVSAAGVIDGDDEAFSAVANGSTITQLMVYKDTGSTATSPLLLFMDTNEDGTPISRTSDGSSIPLVWSSATGRIATP